MYVKSSSLTHSRTVGRRKTVPIRTMAATTTATATAAAAFAEHGGEREKERRGRLKFNAVAFTAAFLSQGQRSSSE